VQSQSRGQGVQYGILSSLDYRIGEKLMTYADTAVTRPEFARELPRFVAEIRDIFSGEEIRHYLDHLEPLRCLYGVSDEVLSMGKRPACEKRQGTKSRSVVRRRGGGLYGDLSGA
jgi:hypothetical protein